ncbi:MAG: hypothetical protein Q4B82_08270 [Alysiella sp.]|uniref:hypothetical protein n=1 Tax=Alysiella sp. TaxID=1872483 RepID=UPI0026DCAE26|nr:hypothetical protein [Alysiella sp.]MDO4434556.1 hypothetical protein [Alysiella sp.]
MDIGSSTSLHQDLFVLDEDTGKEYFFQFKNHDIHFRKGNQITMAWLILDDNPNLYADDVKNVKDKNTMSHLNWKNSMAT